MLLLSIEVKEKRLLKHLLEVIDVLTVSHGISDVVVLLYNTHMAKR